MLLLIIGLGGIQGDRSHGADRFADLVVSKGERGIIELIAPAVERLEGLSVGCDHGPGGVVHHGHMLRPALTDHGQFAAGDDDALRIDNANGTVRVLL